MPALTIISGGQTGVDRAALDAAIALGIPYGGWCPNGGWAEDFVTPPGLLKHYPRLRETPSADPAQRTEWNLRDADATLIVTDAAGIAVSRGTKLGRELAEKHDKPLLTIDLDAPDAVQRAAAWLNALLTAHANTPFSLGIGGPRESEAPGIYAKARTAIALILASAGDGAAYDGSGGGEAGRL